MSGPTNYQAKKGFILLEVVFSLVLLGISLLLISLAVGTVSEIKQAGEKTQTINWARKYLETERTSEFTEIAEKEEEKGGYFFKLEVEELTENLKQLTVKVNKEKEEEVKLKTVVNRWH